VREVFQAAKSPIESIGNLSPRVNSTRLHDFQAWLYFLESIERVPECHVILQQACGVCLLGKHELALCSMFAIL
jgi:hypothetical protein